MNDLSGFGIVLLFIVGGIGFLLISLLIGKLLRPDNPNDQKNTTYESGEEPVGSSWGHFNVRFYVVALIFLLFEAELVFLFPWAVVFADQHMMEESEGLWARFSMVETFIFVTILAVGLAYVWAGGMLKWARPKSKASSFTSKIPDIEYQKFE